MRFASLGSGSEGNALVVEAGSTRILIDCGFGVRECVTRLARLGLAPEDLTAIFVTHEHGDHVCGVPAMAGRYNIGVWLTFGTLSVVNGKLGDMPRIYGFDSHDTLVVGDLEIRPFPVPHDAREPVQFVITDGAHRLGVLTDLGMSTPHVVASLNGCDALVLECNHDSGMLMGGNYPASLKQRIAGRHGHLCNADAAALLASLDCSRLQHVVAAHLSRENNHPDLARAALAAALNCSADWIGLAEQHAGFEWRSLA